MFFRSPVSRHVRRVVLEVVAIMGAVGALGCGGSDGAQATSLNLDTDHNGICDGDEGKTAPSTLTSCMSADAGCPVTKLQGAECEAACQNALALIMADKSCFPYHNFWPFSDLKTCISQCTSWGPCAPTYTFCFGNGNDCAQARQCRIDKLR